MNSKILATVNGVAITEAEVDAMVATYMQHGQNVNNEQGRKMVLEQLISKKLLLLDAQKNLFEYDPEFKKELDAVKSDLLVNFTMKKALEKVTVKDEDVKEYYENNKEMFVDGEKVGASHILVDSEEKANEILEKINSGAVSFEDAARENSSCPSSAQGGNLGEFGRGQMVPEFDKAVFAMNEGEITKEPVKTQFGYHLIKLISKSEASIMPLADILPQLRESLLNEKRRSAYQSKINQLKIMFPVDMH
jgi:peptidyl-prolyl cis-trans isomerase C